MLSANSNISSVLPYGKHRVNEVDTTTKSQEDVCITLENDNKVIKLFFVDLVGTISLSLL